MFTTILMLSYVSRNGERKVIEMVLFDRADPNLTADDSQGRNLRFPSEKVEDARRRPHDRFCRKRWERNRSTDLR